MATIEISGRVLQVRPSSTFTLDEMKKRVLPWRAQLRVLESTAKEPGPDFEAESLTLAEAGLLLYLDRNPEAPAAIGASPAADLWPLFAKVRALAAGEEEPKGEAKGP